MKCLAAFYPPSCQEPSPMSGFCNDRLFGQPMSFEQTDVLIAHF
jgi:hypothetical protein